MASAGSQDFHRRLEQPRIGQLSMYEAGEEQEPDMCLTLATCLLELTSSLFRLLFFKRKNGVCAQAQALHMLHP